MTITDSDRVFDRQDEIDDTQVPHYSSSGPSDRRGVTRAGLKRPSFSFDAYFTGPVRGYGVFQDRSAALKKEFTVDMNGAWEGSVFVLNEDFRFADGEKSKRIWRVEKRPNGLCSATADDIVGTAEGTPWEHGIRWRYLLKVPVGGREITLRFDDRMFLQENGVLINVSDARKFGIKVARLAASFMKS